MFFCSLYKGHECLMPDTELYKADRSYVPALRAGSRLGAGPGGIFQLQSFSSSVRADSQCDGVWAARAEWELCSSSPKKMQTQQVSVQPRKFPGKTSWRKAKPAQ